MRDLEEEKRIKEYMAAKMAHIKMYNECMNLADGLDVAKFAELVRADEREACAKVCDEIDVEANKKFKASGKSNMYEQGVSDGANACSVAIRARGNHD